MKEMHREFRSDVIYQPETEVQFPHLTVGQTLQFAALAKTPQNRLPGVSREVHATHLRDVAMAIFGISHTVNTKVGNDFVRGVSGGERKRVSIAEVALAQSSLQCWDNSTRGLDSATAVEFIRTIRLSVDIMESAGRVWGHRGFPGPVTTRDDGWRERVRSMRHASVRRYTGREDAPGQ